MFLVLILILAYAGVMRRKYPTENESTLRSRVSEILKRASGLRGGNAYKAKKVKQTSAPATAVYTPRATEKSLQDVTDRSPSSSEDDKPTQKSKELHQHMYHQRQMLDSVLPS